ncbi:unnamed protein product [Closterium sp. NIES-54]
MPPLPLLKASSLPADCSDHIRSLRIYALSAVTSSSSPAASSAAASFPPSSSFTTPPAEAISADANTAASSLVASSPIGSSPVASSPMASSAIPSYADAPSFPAASPLVGLPHSALFPVSRDSSRQSSLDSQSQAWKQPTFQRTNQRLLFWEAARNGECSQSLRTTLLRTQSCAVLANAGASASAYASSSSPRGSAAVPFPVGSSGVVARSTSSGNELADVAAAVARRGERTRRLSSGVVEAAQRITAGRESAGGLTTGCSTSSGSSVGSTCSSSAPSAGNSGSNSPRICFPVAPLRTSSCPVEDNSTNGDRIDVDNPIRSQSQSHVHSRVSSQSLGNSPGAATSRPVWRTASIESGAEASNPLPALPSSPLARAVADESVFHWAARTRMARARMASVPST